MQTHCIHVKANKVDFFISVIAKKVMYMSIRSTDKNIKRTQKILQIGKKTRQTAWGSIETCETSA